MPRRAGNTWDIYAPRNTYRTADDRWIAMSGSAPTVFEAAEIPAAPVYDVTDLVADEQMAAREVFRRIPDQLGSLLVQTPVPRLSGVDGRIDHLGPELGAHTREVLTEVAGLDSSKFDDLAARQEGRRFLRSLRAALDPAARRPGGRSGAAPAPRSGR